MLFIISYICHLGDIVDSVFEVATQQKAWDNFTKPQRKTLTQWKDYAQEVRTEINKAIEKPVENKNGNGDEPPAKRSKTEGMSTIGIKTYIHIHTYIHYITCTI